MTFLGGILQRKIPQELILCMSLITACLRRRFSALRHIVTDYYSHLILKLATDQLHFSWNQIKINFVKI